MEIILLPSKSYQAPKFFHIALLFSISSLGSEYESNFPKLCINIRLGLECKKGFYLYNLYVFFDLPKFNLLQMFLILSTK